MVDVAQQIEALEQKAVNLKRQVRVDSESRELHKSTSHEKF